MKHNMILRIGAVAFSIAVFAVYLSCQTPRSEPAPTSTTRPAMLPGSKSSAHAVDENVLFGDPPATQKSSQEFKVFPGSKSAAPTFTPPSKPGPEDRRDFLPSSKSGPVLGGPKERGMSVIGESPATTAPASQP